MFIVFHCCVCCLRLFALLITFDYVAEEDDYITFRVGVVIVVSDKSDADWWEGLVEGKPD